MDTFDTMKPIDNIEMDNLADDDFDYSVDNAETSFNELLAEDNDNGEMIPTSNIETQRVKMNDQYINDYFKKLNYDVDPTIESLVKTDLKVQKEKGKQQIYYYLPKNQPYNGRKLRITNPSDGKPTSLKTLARSMDGKYYVNEVLKLDLTTFKPIQPENRITDPDILDVLQREQGENANRRVILSGYTRDIELNAFDKPIKALSPEDIGILRDYQNILRSENDIDGSKVIDSKIEQWDNLNPEYKNIQDELVLANKRLVDLFAEKSVLDHNIDKLYKEKNESALNENKLNEIDREIDKYEAERTRIDNQLRKYNDQVAEWVVKKAEMLPLKEVFDDPALKLKEKLRILFKRHGVTIVSLATSVGLIISNIAVALGIKPSINTTSGGNKPNNGLPNKAYNVAKSTIKRVSGWLKALAQKSAAAIPGIIGSIVSFILKTAGSVVGYVSEYLYIALVGLTIYVFDYLKNKM